MADSGCASGDGFVLLTRDRKTSCKVHLFGATLTSWVNQGEEMIFVSEKAKFDNKAAIRGGIPIVFPNFGPWKLGPQHGFARISPWTVEKPAAKNENGDVVASFSLEDNEYTRAMWNENKFKVTYTVVLGDNSLQTSLRVDNTGSAAFDFTCLLHTYFRVPDVTTAAVSNLRGCTFTDKVGADIIAVEDRDLVTVDKPVDRIYEKTPNEHLISGVTGQRTISLQKVNLPDTVVWNPWEKALTMADLGAGYVNMLCVESGHVVEPVHLPPGRQFVASQILTVIHR